MESGIAAIIIGGIVYIVSIIYLLYKMNEDKDI